MSLNKAVYKNRKATLKKKAEELSILCDVPVALVCYDPDGKVDTWPEDKSKVDEILTEFARKQNLKLPSSETTAKNKNGNQDLQVMENGNILDEEKKKKRKNAVKKVYKTWDERFDYLPEEDLIEILEVIESKEKSLAQRVKAEEVGKKRKGTQVDDDDDGLVTLRLGRYDYSASSSSSGNLTKDKGKCSIESSSNGSDFRHGIAKGIGDLGVQLEESRKVTEAVPITMPQKTIQFYF
ncbi:mads box protein, putative [Ricinus communis]|uniref:Mads box protein, putative n=1 Tax=Ricinus communis TaxID=3988 RepID=B9RM40_RICCO|nr:mads box protein, putative [Ricinus communis]|eukprot:XP_002514809.1 agamous-like MADS-box protein AGL103 [Ricinus communis]